VWLLLLFHFKIPTAVSYIVKLRSLLVAVAVGVLHIDRQLRMRHNLQLRMHLDRQLVFAYPTTSRDGHILEKRISAYVVDEHHHDQKVCAIFP
jgi:hypothetical protein